MGGAATILPLFLPMKNIGIDGIGIDGGIRAYVLRSPLYSGKRNLYIDTIISGFRGLPEPWRSGLARALKRGVPGVPLALGPPRQWRTPSRSQAGRKGRRRWHAPPTSTTSAAVHQHI